MGGRPESAAQGRSARGARMEREVVSWTVRVPKRGLMCKADLGAPLGVGISEVSLRLAQVVKGAESGDKLRSLRRPFHPDLQFLCIWPFMECL